MNFLFDNNLRPGWAGIFSAASKRIFLDAELGQVCHLREKFAADTKDEEWLAALGNAGHWAIVSCDKFRKQSGAERQVIRQRGLSVFVLQRRRPHGVCSSRPASAATGTGLTGARAVKAPAASTSILRVAATIWATVCWQ